MMIDLEALYKLPYVTGQFPGVGGRLRAMPEHFVVEEVALYLPEDAGKHLYVNLTKVGLTTKEVQRSLERLFGLRTGEVGYAGLKDKHARTTQTFSICVEQFNQEAIERAPDRIAAELPVTVNWARRHTNKLRPGHLLGNRFTVTVTECPYPAAEIAQRAQLVGQALQQAGALNFFGPQRFGIAGANVIRGYELLTGQRRERDKWLRRFLLSSYQSFLCNCYLARRFEMGAFAYLLPGDVAKKTDTGGLFNVVDPIAETERYLRRAISFTAPLFGSKMWAAQDEAGRLEASVLAEAGVALSDFQRVGVEGSRRLGRLLLGDLQTSATADGLCLTFSLPKGAFATTILREFMKVDLAETPDLDGLDGEG